MRAHRATTTTFTNFRADGSEKLTVVEVSDHDLQLDFDDGNRRAAVMLEAEEIAQLHVLLGNLLAGKEGSAVFGDREVVHLRVNYNNWGDPYDEGARFAIEFGDHDTVYVDLTNDELRGLHKLLGARIG
jgi:hypothetical protein